MLSEHRGSDCGWQIHMKDVGEPKTVLVMDAIDSESFLFILSVIDCSDHLPSNPQVPHPILAQHQEHHFLEPTENESLPDKAVFENFGIHMGSTSSQLVGQEMKTLKDSSLQKIMDLWKNRTQFYVSAFKYVSKPLHLSININMTCQV